MIVGDFVRRGIAPLKHRHRPLWELNQVCGSVPRRKYHMTMAHLTTCMTFLQSGTNHVMKEGIVLMFEDSLADEVRLAMPLYNEYGVAGTSAIIPPPAPREGRRRPEREASYGDASPEDPWSSDDEEDEEIALPTAGAAGATPPVVTAGNPPGTRLAPGWRALARPPVFRRRRNRSKCRSASCCLWWTQWRRPGLHPGRAPLEAWRSRGGSSWGRNGHTGESCFPLLTLCLLLFFEG